MPSSIAGLLRASAQAAADSIAVVAPDRAPLTYGALVAHTERITASLNGCGIGREDRVAVVLPNGPEMATAFLAVASAATCAPLDPAYRADELDFHITDLGARALIVQAGVASPAREVARARGIAVLEVMVDPGAPAGVFSLSGGAVPPAARPGAAGPDDVALVLHTSGTTARPKIVPLRHANLCASALHVSASLELTPSDRCLNVMPLFHIHGLIGALLSSLHAGASVVCTPGFLAPRFFDWLAASGATWYTAVPTMHQSILTRAGAHADEIACARLRCVRSSSAALPVRVLTELERVFDAPVVEAYGMTEASHQMCANPLRDRRPGSVGIATGVRVAVMDDGGALLPAGRTGEIVVRGPGVMDGYENNPDANRAAFHDGWFRTGDQGWLDEDGYLRLTGRRKEMINRGGEKIAPKEVDEVLLDHPAVAEAVAFAMPHDTLGEDVAAAVVLRHPGAATAQQLRSFAGARLAHFKVPSRIVFLDTIPRGPTGKLQRVGLAERLGVTARAPAGPAPYVAPATPVEQALCAVWEEVLGVPRVGVHDDFFALGGDSMLATRIAARVRDRLSADVELIALFDAPTVAAMANVLRGAAVPAAEVWNVA